MKNVKRLYEVETSGNGQKKLKKQKHVMHSLTRDRIIKVARAKFPVRRSARKSRNSENLGPNPK